MQPFLGARMIIRIIGIVVLLVALGFVGYYIDMPEPTAEPAPAPVVTSTSVPIGGAFTLTDHHGATVTDATYHGKYTLVFFGFTNCPDVCPTTLLTIADLMARVDAEGQKITPLFISVDTNDTPALMAEYVANFHPSIVGLSGTAEQIATTAKAYKVYHARVEQPDTSLGYTMDHSAFLFFMSPEGNYIAHFGYQDPLDKMATRINAELGAQP